MTYYPYGLNFFFAGKAVRQDALRNCSFTFFACCIVGNSQEDRSKRLLQFGVVGTRCRLWASVLCGGDTLNQEISRFKVKGSSSPSPKTACSHPHTLWPARILKLANTFIHHICTQPIYLSRSTLPSRQANRSIFTTVVHFSPLLSSVQIASFVTTNCTP
jgi:hypothetical protein